MDNLFAKLSALAPSGVGAAAPAESTPQDIPKEELMTLCMKMNKRMQAMEAKGKEIMKKKTTLTAERQKMLDLFRMVISVPTITKEDADLDLNALEQSWADFELRRRDQLTDLQARLVAKDQLMQQSLKAMEDHYKTTIADMRAGGGNNDPQTAEGEGADNSNKGTSIDAIIEAEKEKMAAQSAQQDLQRRLSKSDAEVERLRGVEAYLKQQLLAMEGAITAKNTEIESIQKDLEAHKTSYEEKVVFLQMQMTAAKARDEERGKDTAAHRATVEKLSAQIAALQRLLEEKELSYKSNKDMIQALQTRLIELEPELALGRDKIAQLERNNNAQALMKAEQSALTQSLRTDMKNALDEVEAGKKRCRELEEFKVKAEGQLLRLAALTEQAQTLQSAIEDRDSLITRMRAEQQASERNHAMRTAMLATCEAQLDTLQEQLVVRDATCAEAIERVTSLQTALAGTEARLAERVKEAAAEISALETRINTIERDRDVALHSLEKIHEEAVEALKRDHAKKSAMARTLLSEKEEEVRTLSAKVAELHEEINSGTPQERKIFELATSQARRESMHGAHNDTRELAFAQLQGKLAARDLELARTQQALAALQGEAGELRRTHQREGINMDYLKNIVIQYMTFPAQSSEKMSLVPVLAMLLQFSPKELTAVQRAALLEPAQGGGLWSSLGLGGGASASAAVGAPMAMPLFSSSRPAKEVKRPATAVAAVSGSSPAGKGTPAGAGGGGGSASKGGVGLSGGAMTTAALVGQQQQQQQQGGNAVSGGVRAATAMTGGEKKVFPSQSDTADSSGEYQPPSPFSHSHHSAVGPLSPSTSNSDADPEVVGSYSPPKLPPQFTLAGAARSAQSAAAASSGTLSSQSQHQQQQGSLMMEAHTDTGSTDDPTFATPLKARPDPSPSTRATTRTHAGSGSFTKAGTSNNSTAANVSTGAAVGAGNGASATAAATPGSMPRPRGSANRMPLNRSGSGMNASDYEFQLKLKTIGSDILSLDNSVSYDDADLDMGGEATYVDYEEGIEEGDELDDGQDGTSV